MSAFSSVTASRPKSGPLGTLAGDLADRTIVVLSHLRRLRVGGSAEKEWRKCEEALCVRQATAGEDFESESTDTKPKRT